MTRKPTLIRAGRPCAEPDLVLVVQAAGTQKYLGDADDVGHYALSQLRMANWSEAGEDVGWEQTNLLDHDIDIWGILLSVDSSMQHVRIVSTYAREQMALLGLWDLLADGRATLTGADPWSERDLDGGHDTASDGYCILEGPPTIVCFRLAGRGTVYTWVDPGNYGAGDLIPRPQSDSCCIEHWYSPNSLAEQVDAVCTWIDSYRAACKSLNLGPWELTAAQQASYGYRSAYMRHRIVTHDNQLVLDAERTALYGGRCECNHIGTLHSRPRIDDDVNAKDGQSSARYGLGTIYHLDVNSLYPSVAYKARLPTRLMAVSRDVPIGTALAAAENCACVCAVDVHTKYPVLPVRHEKKVMWPIGSFTTVVCGPELLLAAEYCAEIKVHWMATYEVGQIYHNWVKGLYEERVRRNKLGDRDIGDCIKRILNASFGRWSQQSKRWVDAYDQDTIAPYYQWYGQVMPSGDRERLRSLAWRVQRLIVPVDSDDPSVAEPDDSMPVITAYVNSLGRVRLWRLLETCGQDNVYYYDTDSIWCNQAGYDALFWCGEVDESSLGKLKIKGACNTLRIIGRQCYEADGILHMAGVSERLVRSGDAYALQLRTPPLSHYLLKGCSPGLDRHVARCRTDKVYEHGVVHLDGSVTPHRFRNR
jgi:hypothetical protein